MLYFNLAKDSKISFILVLKGDGNREWSVKNLFLNKGFYLILKTLNMLGI